jgi:EAL domain-containing protein (putative c-di-GMP-specific phosphodiesterase class I)
VFINVDFHILQKTEPVPKPEEMDVILEISEQEVVHDVEKFLEVTRKWREKGYKFAIDDFGSGFVSLPFLARLIPDYIKMDRSTILQAVSSQDFGDFLKDLVIALRKYTKEGIIAEGVETEKELKAANAMGTYLVQGFFLGKPQELN